MERVLFTILAAIAAAAGVGVVAQRSATRSALFLLVNFCCLAGLYLLLSAEFVAMAQVIIYAGAIVVLFLFVVLLLGIERVEEARDMRLYQGIAGALLGTLLLAGIAWALVLAWAGPGAGPAPAENAAQIGQALLGAYAIPFEMAGVVLLVAIVGTVVLARKGAGGRGGDSSPPAVAQNDRLRK
jgi:NADH-quinone oxidoreductase subunit J